jgi:hypothetical protein
MKALPYNQQKIMELLADLDKSGHELSHGGAGISFDQRSMNALIKKGLVKTEFRSRLRADDMEQVYWSVYVAVPTPLMAALE